MSIPIFPPARDGDLLAWSTNFTQKLSLGPSSFGLTNEQAAAYAGLHAAYQAAYAAVRNPNTNSKQAVIAKNHAREKLLDGPNGAWQLVRIIQAYPGTTDAMRGELGLRIAEREHTPRPAPEFPPQLSLEGTFGRMVRVRLRDIENPARRGKPPIAAGAIVLYAVGEVVPESASQWAFGANTFKTLIDLEIPLSVPAGAKVWVTAFWYNDRKQAGPAALPESTRIADAYSAAA